MKLITATDISPKMVNIFSVAFVLVVFRVCGCWKYFCCAQLWAGDTVHQAVGAAVGVAVAADAGAAVRSVVVDVVTVLTKVSVCMSVTCLSNVLQKS